MHKSQALRIHKKFFLSLTLRALLILGIRSESKKTLISKTIKIGKIKLYSSITNRVKREIMVINQSKI